VKSRGSVTGEVTRDLASTEHFKSPRPGIARWARPSEKRTPAASPVAEHFKLKMLESISGMEKNYNTDLKKKSVSPVRRIPTNYEVF